MKKLLSIMLAFVMMLSMSTVVFAEGVTTPAAPSDMEEVTITKDYIATNENTTSPGEEFIFNITRKDVSDAAENITVENMPIPTISNVSYGAGEAGSDNKSKQITVSLPVYTSVGIYTYTIRETQGSSAGVTYYNKDILLVVTVIQGEDNKLRIAAVHTEDDFEGNGDDGTKKNNFANVYSAGSLSVKKIVTGDFGDRNKEFTVTVTFKAPEGKEVNSTISYIDGDEKIFAPKWTNGEATAEISLKHNETVTFTNIPYGVQYSVVETTYSDYTTTYKLDNQEKEAITNNTLSDSTDLVEITNNKGGTIDTGISMDSLPYILLLAIAVIGLCVFFTRSRFNDKK